MVEVNFENIQKKINCAIVELQTLAIKEISNLFFNIEVNQLKLDCTEGQGVRGKYDNKTNNQLKLSYQYYEYYFEYYLSYDQLEYYILKEGKTIKESNLEDFWEDDVMIKIYINYLKKDLKKLKIPFNE